MSKLGCNVLGLFLVMVMVGMVKGSGELREGSRMRYLKDGLGGVDGVLMMSYYDYNPMDDGRVETPDFSNGDGIRVIPYLVCSETRDGVSITYYSYYSTGDGRVKSPNYIGNRRRVLSDVYFYKGYHPYRISHRANPGEKFIWHIGDYIAVKNNQDCSRITHGTNATLLFMDERVDTSFLDQTLSRSFKNYDISFKIIPITDKKFYKYKAFNVTFGGRDKFWVIHRLMNDQSLAQGSLHSAPLVLSPDVEMVKDEEFSLNSFQVVDESTSQMGNAEIAGTVISSMVGLSVLSIIVFVIQRKFKFSFSKDSNSPGIFSIFNRFVGTKETTPSKSYDNSTMRPRENDLSEDYISQTQSFNDNDNETNSENSYSTEESENAMDVQSHQDDTENDASNP